MAIQIYKSYLLGNPGYKGGKTLGEIKTEAKKIYKLSSNENPLGASPLAVEALRSSLQDLHLYPDRTTGGLQEALSIFYKDQLSPGHFICGNAGSEVIEHIIRAFLGEGLECIVSNPCFMPYVMFSEWQGARVVDVPLLLPDYRLDTEGILRAVTERTRLLFLTSPNNPTGTYIPGEELEGLLSRLPDHVVTVLDEVYYRFASAPGYTTALPYVLAGKKVIGLNSFSKTYGLASLRVGWAYSTLEIAGYVRKWSKPFLINKLTMNAAIAALDDEPFVGKTVQLVQQERERLYPLLDEIGVRYWPSQANFIMIKPEMDEFELEEKMLKEGVMVRPVGSFGAPGCVRVTIGTRAANNAYIRALKKMLGNG